MLSKKSKQFEVGGLTISYKGLGAISIDELMHALVEDIHALKDIYNIQFVKGPRLKLYATDEYGTPVRISRPTGGKLVFMDTTHYRPACKDYEL